MHKNVNVFNTTGLYILKWLKQYVICYVYFSTINIKTWQRKGGPRVERELPYFCVPKMGGVVIGMLGERQATQHGDLQAQKPLLPHGHLWQNLGRKLDLYPDLPYEGDLSAARS